MAGARHYTQLVCWQLADAIRIETFKLTRRPSYQRDLKLKAQTEDAIDSVCRNVAEGFGCTSHAEFARFLEISRRSLNELLDCLRSAELKGYVAATESGAIHALAERLYPAFGRFISYLRRTPSRGAGKSRRPRTDAGQLDRTDIRQTNRTDRRQADRTDRHQADRTDRRQADRTDRHQPNRTDRHQQPNRTDER